MKLSPNFSLSEFTASSTAQKLGIDNTPNKNEIRRLNGLVDHILQPLRTWAGRPVKISSGFRCSELNRRIGGSAGSQHVTGHAADIEIPGIDNKTVAQWIADYTPFDQIILEYYVEEQGINSGWIHVSYDPRRNRKSKLIATKKNGNTIYEFTDNFSV